MAIIKTGSAKYEGLGKDGVGHVSTGSGALSAALRRMRSGRSGLARKAVA